MNSKRLKFRVSFSLAIFLSPLLVFGQGFSLANSSFSGIITEILSVLAILTPLLSGLAFIVFFWGLTKFILHSDSAPDIAKGKNYMFWGVIALFILITFNTIIIAVGADLGLGTTGTMPTLPTSGGGTGGGTITNP